MVLYRNEIYQYTLFLHIMPNAEMSGNDKTVAQPTKLADDKEQALFVELLALEDDELLGILLGELEVEAAAMKVLVEKIRAFAVAG